MKKILLFLLCALVVFSSSIAQAEENTADRVQNLIGGVCASMTGEKDMQAWISSSLSEAPAAEWYAITLSQMGAYDLSSCKDFLISSFENTSSRASVTRQKFALALLAIEADLSAIQSETDETIGAQGIMSWVYGLHLIHNGFVSESHTENSIIDTLLSLQFEDGGWALSGSIGNIDVTAMTMQALAPYMNVRNDVKITLERATELISELQDDDAGYKSYGVSNPESAAQVIVALTAMGIDPFTDARFIKNGLTLLDAVERFRLENGTFAHTLGGAENAMATVQTLYGLVSYKRMLNGQTPYYTFDKTEAASASCVHAASVPAYKWIAIGIAAALSVIASIVLFLGKKRSYKNYLFILILFAALAAFIFLSDFETAENYYTEPVRKENIIGSVTLEIRCDTISGSTDKKHIPEDGAILKNTEFNLSEGDTVYDILVEACKANKIHMEKSGAEGMIYVVGLGYIYEFDYGDLSGWKYYVNGVSPSVGCDQYTLKDGDTIKWLYSLELGNDTGN